MSNSFTFFDALPVAASSPLALFGYLAALAASVALVWRVRRNQNLLSRIKDIPSKDRKDTLQAEMGVVLPKSISAEQWLRSRVQQYYFLGFVVLVLCVTLIGVIAFTYSAGPNQHAEDGNAVGEARRPKAEVAGVTSIDFRSSEIGDSLAPGHGTGHLLVTTHIDVRNVTEPAASLTWSGTTGTLRIGGATIPFRSYFFTNLTDEGPWTGQDPVDARPVAIRGGEVVGHDVMFIPENTGAGRYRWDDFLRAIDRPGEANPVFEIAVATKVGETAEAPIRRRCTARLDEFMDRYHALARANTKSHWITVECGEQGERQ